MSIVLYVSEITGYLEENEMNESKSNRYLHLNLSLRIPFDRYHRHLNPNALRGTPKPLAISGGYDKLRGTL